MKIIKFKSLDEVLLFSSVDSYQSVDPFSFFAPETFYFGRKLKNYIELRAYYGFLGVNLNLDEITSRDFLYHCHKMLPLPSEDDLEYFGEKLDDKYYILYMASGVLFRVKKGLPVFKFRFPKDFTKFNLVYNEKKFIKNFLLDVIFFVRKEGDVLIISTENYGKNSKKIALDLLTKVYEYISFFWIKNGYDPKKEEAFTKMPLFKKVYRKTYKRMKKKGI